MPPTKPVMRATKWLLILLAIAGICMAVLIHRSKHPANHYSKEHLRPFRDAVEWTLYSLDPSALREESLQDSFHGYLVLGSRQGNDPQSLRQIVQELEDAAEKWSGDIAFCFNPRHGIRVSENGKTFDLSICYECSRVYIYEGSKEVGAMLLATDAQREPSPERLNELLAKAGVRLPMKPKHDQ